MFPRGHSTLSSLAILLTLSSTVLSPVGRIALHNVRVFNGSVLVPASTVIIDRGVIGDRCTGCAAYGCPECAPVVDFDGKGMTLLPGLIDAHAHPSNVTTLDILTSQGITTIIQANCPDKALISASLQAVSANGLHAKLIGAGNSGWLINSTAMVPSFIIGQVSLGAELIKMISEQPGLTQEQQNAIVARAHAAGKQVILHTQLYGDWVMGLAAGVDQIHHSPIDKPIDDAIIKKFKAQRTLACPTLVMMRSIIDQLAPANYSFSPAMESLENLVAACLTPAEALNAATRNTAQHFNLTDRGIIRDWMRADLLLVNGDPTANISTTRNIVGVWIDGVRYRH
ncbi:hypothetical protein GQ53DRAFT_789737 [Thozetella sp. PMI_491]|nr:hypothetical protein GQ53DRAFT_789737 [Thozetella sp. PMI_491]